VRRATESLRVAINAARHDYQKLNLEIVRDVVERSMGDLRGFARHALALCAD
jgi:hypothetical protein